MVFTDQEYNVEIENTKPVGLTPKRIKIIKYLVNFILESGQPHLINESRGKVETEVIV